MCSTQWSAHSLAPAASVAMRPSKLFLTCFERTRNYSMQENSHQEAENWTPSPGRQHSFYAALSKLDGSTNRAAPTINDCSPLMRMEKSCSRPCAKLLAATPHSSLTRFRSRAEHFLTPKRSVNTHLPTSKDVFPIFKLVFANCDRCSK